MAQDILCKLNAAGITGTLLDCCEDYLKDRKQHTAIPGATYRWDGMKCAVAQCSLLGPLLSPLFINFVTDIRTNIRLFADDTSLCIYLETTKTAAFHINTELYPTGSLN